MQHVVFYKIDRVYYKNRPIYCTKSFFYYTLVVINDLDHTIS